MTLTNQERLDEIKATLHYWDAMYAQHGLAPLPPAVAAQESARHLNRAEIDWLISVAERQGMLPGNPHPDTQEGPVSFQFGATADKASDIRKKLQNDRDAQLGDLRRGEEEGQPGQQPDPDVRDQLEGDLADAGIAAAEAAARKLKGASSFQVTVSGHRNPDGTQAVSVAINAAP